MFLHLTSSSIDDHHDDSKRTNLETFERFVKENNLKLDYRKGSRHKKNARTSNEAGSIGEVVEIRGSTTAQPTQPPRRSSRLAQKSQNSQKPDGGNHVVYFFV